MEDGEVEYLSDQTPLSSDRSNFTNLFRESTTTTSVDTFLDDEFLKSMQTCTHTHTCNPPGPGPDVVVHTHTCYHTHTQVFMSEEEDADRRLKINEQNSALKSRRRPCGGNRAAVRKYREKKKAHTAHLEEEVKKLRLLNQQLVKKLQGQALLEAEVLRLRSLFVDLRGKIDAELGSVNHPVQKQSCSTSTTPFKEADCRVQPIIGSGTTSTDLQCKLGVPCQLHPPLPRPPVDANMDANRALVSSASQTE